MNLYHSFPDRLADGICISMSILSPRGIAHRMISEYIFFCTDLLLTEIHMRIWAFWLSKDEIQSGTLGLTTVLFDSLMKITDQIR